MTVENSEQTPFILVSAQCPESTGREEVITPLTHEADPFTFPAVRLSDRSAIPTADRWYRVLVDDEVGSEQVTQFVGSIPPDALRIIFINTKKCFSSYEARDKCGRVSRTHRLGQVRVFTYLRPRFIAWRIQGRTSCVCLECSTRRAARAFDTKRSAVGFEKDLFLIGHLTFLNCHFGFESES